MIHQNKNIVLPGKHGRPIVADVCFSTSEIQKPVVIFCHGYKGFKDWGAWNLVGEAFANRGFFFIKFNFSFNGGTIDQPVDFPDLKAFGNNNYTKEMDDLDQVLNWVVSKEFEYKEHVMTDNITVIGHSRGGGIAALTAAVDRRVSRLVTWAGVSDYEKRFPIGAQLSDWEKEGVMYIENGRTRQKMPHFYQFYTNFVENKERLDIAKAVKKLEVPYLIIHGDSDTTVAVQEAVFLHSLNSKSNLYILEGANHVFGAQHPWTDRELPKDMKIVIQKTIDFCN